MSATPQLGVALLCDRDGRFARLLRDDLNLLRSVAFGTSFVDLVTEDCREKASVFLASIQQQGAAFNWELNLARAERTTCLSFTGSRSEEGLTIIGGISRAAAVQLMQALSSSRSEFQSLLKTAAASMTEDSGHPYEHVFEELTRVNNELTNAQRDLAKTNADLADTLHALDRKTSQIRAQAQLLDIAYDAIMVVTFHGDIRFWNRGAEQLYGWSPQEAVGQNSRRLLQTQFPEPIEDIRRILREQGTWEGELVHTARDGSRVVVASRQVLASDSYDDDSVLVINRDITERKRVEEALRVSDRMAAASRLGSALAHEINNPLAILTNTLFLLEATGTTPEGKNILRQAEEALERVTSITRQMLALYRENATPRLVNVRKAVSDVVAAFADGIQAKHIALREQYDFQGDLVAVEADLLHMFSSIIRNAIDSVPEGGRLRIRVAPAPSRNRTPATGVRITVADNGAGIPPDQQKNLFEPFFSTTERKGAGLGLWTTRSILHKYNGEIRVRTCTRVGRSGTVISIFLPAVIAANRQRDRGAAS